ncbi:hypothetical protein ISN76_11175 [Dyella halodurans]|uniref:Uncharacterized protein n=1 Tax=Dyella halodurans TaxID=1920171 RepID=A0ABV9C3K9_9GAMM|nr:hypothetical protein [Dyella halodurans]
MEIIAYAIRAFLNITASGLMLLIAVSVLIPAMDSSADSPSWKNADVGGALVLLALAVFSGYLAVRFWRHQPKVNSLATCAILNGLACMAFLGVLAMYVLNH